MKFQLKLTNAGFAELQNWLKYMFPMVKEKELYTVYFSLIEVNKKFYEQSFILKSEYKFKLTYSQAAAILDAYTNFPAPPGHFPFVANVCAEFHSKIC